jgi:hypothetical protein
MKMPQFARDIRCIGEKRMRTDRLNLYLERVLEQTCRSLPHGGNHGLRAFVAQRLSDAAFAGKTTLGELGIVARKALADYEATSKRENQLNSSGGFVFSDCHQAAE